MNDFFGLFFDLLAKYIMKLNQGRDDYIEWSGIFWHVF